MDKEQRHKLKEIEIKGFKSIGKKQNIYFGDINVLIGANGVGKSNLVSFFQLLNRLSEEQLQAFIGKQGYADSILHYGTKTTDRFSARLSFVNEVNSILNYEFALVHSYAGQMMFAYENIDNNAFIMGTQKRAKLITMGSGHAESKLLHEKSSSKATDILALLRQIKVFQFHDTSDRSLIRQPGMMQDNRYLHSDGSNLSSYLYQMKKSKTGADYYKRIISRICEIMPQFKDFALEPLMDNPAMIRLDWKHKRKEHIFGVNQISDGSLRFMALATLLLQPPDSLPNVIVIDEPELGLHPEALIDLVGMIKIAAQNCQIILSTQSSFLLDFFNVNDIIVVEAKDDTTIFNRLEQNKLTEWVKDYTMSELWEKNLIGGRP
ncbi:MAG: AAA family ATPase [Candidatus Cloacimonetes bacterium]|nr:AAA family ATPase [Candidatus Cloacimonadota bacterium]MDY0172450.1 AAA family ATPase [Candidatus Cloacimonadaceae bacterium]